MSRSGNSSNFARRASPLEEPSFTRRNRASQLKGLSFTRRRLYIEVASYAWLPGPRRERLIHMSICKKFKKRKIRQAHNCFNFWEYCATSHRKENYHLHVHFQETKIPWRSMDWKRGVVNLNFDSNTLTFSQGSGEPNALDSERGMRSLYQDFLPFETLMLKPVKARITSLNMSKTVNRSKRHPSVVMQSPARSQWWQSEIRFVYNLWKWWKKSPFCLRHVATHYPQFRKVSFWRWRRQPDQTFVFQPMRLPEAIVPVS